jgi:small subunit ribosomal protein S4e
MTRAGKKYHQKRPSAPSTWPIKRKLAKQHFLPKINPGPHNKDYGMPLLVLVRDVLKIAKNRKEAKFILANRQILVDGRVRTDEKFPVGLMDVVEVPGFDKAYRIQLHESNKLIARELTDGEKEYKVCQVIGKRNVRGGDTQVSLHDGRNILLAEGDERIAQIQGQCSLKIAIPSQEILEVYSLEEEARAMVTEGRHRGKVGSVQEISRRYGPKASEAVLFDEEDVEEREFRTALDYVFVIGPDLQLER